MRDIVYFDLETQKAASEVGGWSKESVRKMRMSVGVTYSTRTGRYVIYPEWEVQALIEQLRRADLVVGFNIKQFDYEVLVGHDLFFDPEQIPTLDLLLDLQKEFPHRLSLDDVAEATLGVKKTAEGMQAIRWFRQGELMKIAEYCCYDVKITRLLHEYGREHGYVWYVDRRGERQKIRVNW